jgi:4-diphosphocytidyl-2-C-methyl-D-erythritol kinase
MLLTSKAKVNLNLYITSKREDGYHLLESLVYFPEHIFDEIEFKKSAKTSLKIIGPFAKNLSNIDDNIILKTFEILKNLYPKNFTSGVEITLTKNLPVASGIGGGSGNAAATLIAINKLFSLNISDDELARVGVQIGADVPVCIKSQTCIMRGIGEEIEAKPNFPKLHLLLVNPLISVSTAEIFKMGNFAFQKPEISQVENYLTSKNDLENNAIKICPVILEVKSEIAKQKGYVISKMSGSGATCFGIFDSEENLTLARKTLAENHKNWWVA